MHPRPRLWYPIATALAVINVASVWFAAQAAEPAHATVHAALSVACVAWALRQRRRLQAEQATGPSPLPASLGSLELEVDQLRQQLAETQDRLDFAERVLASRGARAHDAS